MKILKSLFITFLLFVKKYTPLKAVGIATGNVEIEIKRAKTGIIEKKVFPVALLNFNTLHTVYKYFVAKWIQADNAGEFIGASGFMTQSVYEGKDGICLETSGENYLPTVSTKDSGGTGSVNWIKFKGVRTAAGTEVISFARLGRLFSGTLGFTAANKQFAYQTVSETLAVSDTLTVNWTITIN